MVTHHSQANDELKQLAAQQHVTLPTHPDKSAEAAQQKLSDVSGPAFDKAYAQHMHMVQDHEHDVAAFRKEAQSGQDPAVKAFPRKYFPILEQHLQAAKALTAGG